MNRYTLWKYIVIGIAILVSVIYAAPNLFGEVPAVQVAGARSTVKVDSALQSGIEEALKAANLAPLAVDQEENALRFRFSDTDAQLRARDVIQAKVGANSGYVVALNLVPKAVHSARGELRREFTPDRHIYRDHLMAKLGDLAPPDEQSFHLEVTDDTLAWAEGECEGYMRS